MKRIDPHLVRFNHIEMHGLIDRHLGNQSGTRIQRRMSAAINSKKPNFS
ncbi:hypothetical protein NKG95_31290 [Mesorhizobium sp. M1423]